MTDGIPRCKHGAPVWACNEDALPTVDETRAALLRRYRPRIDDANYERDLDALIAAVRAEAEPKAKADRQALWDKFTGGEKLAYGIGYRDREAESAKTLRALREAAGNVIVASDAHDGSLFDALLVLRAALAATPENADKT